MGVCSPYYLDPGEDPSKFSCRIMGRTPTLFREISELVYPPTNEVIVEVGLLPIE